MITDILALTIVALMVVLTAMVGYILKLHSDRDAMIAHLDDYSDAIQAWLAWEYETNEYIDELQSTIRAYKREYGSVTLAYDITRGKVKAAKIKDTDRVYALTLPGMSIPSDCEVEFSAISRDSNGNIVGGTPVVTRKPESPKNGAKSESNGNANSAKSENVKKQTESTPNAKNSNSAESRDVSTVIIEVGQALKDTLSDAEKNKVKEWLNRDSSKDTSATEYAKWIGKMRNSKGKGK